MKARVLPREEWSRLEVTQLPQIGPLMRPEDVQIVVVEVGERIISTIAVLRVTHFEDLWIDPEYRGNAGAARRLLKVAISEARRFSTWAWGSSDTEHMTDIIERAGGVPLPVKSFAIPLGGN
jgi:hypothetical protein